MIKRKWRPFLLAAVLLLFPAVAARAKINPNYTPLHLVEQAHFILLLKLKPAGKDGKVTAEVVRCLKGEKKAPKGPLTIDLSMTAKPPHAEMVKAIIASLGDGPAMLFVAIDERGEKVSMLHLGGKWVSLDPTEKPDAWEMNEIDKQWEAIWAGGTDMLLKISSLLLKSPDVGVPPVISGVTWDRPVKLSSFKGKVAGMQAVDLDGKGRLRLYAACAAGDRIYSYDRAMTKHRPSSSTRPPGASWPPRFRPPPGPTSSSRFVDETARRKLTARSKVATWADFNADGRLDLASWDGKALSLYVQKADGTLGAAKKLAAAPAGGCLGLAALDAGVPGRPGLLFTGKTGPVLLKPGKDESFAAVKLKLGEADLAALGAPGRCLVADLDGDGLADVLFPFAKSSLFFKGKGQGAFAGAAKCSVALGKPPFGAFLGDYDMDGRLDVFCAARDDCRLWHNRPGLRFESTLHVSGEIAYISKPGGVCGNTCDVNNDGRQDIYIVYSEIAKTGPHIFFNRGFRSTGHAHTIDITEKQIIGGVEAAGQQCGVIADLTGDGVQDQAMVLRNGDFYVFPHEVGNQDPLCLRVALPLGGKPAGPVKVTAWNDRRCLGAWNVAAGTSEAFFGQLETGDIRLRWRLPGAEKACETRITLAESTRYLIPEGAPPPVIRTAGSEDLSPSRSGSADGDRPEVSSNALVWAGIAAGAVVLVLVVLLLKRRK